MEINALFFKIMSNKDRLKIMNSLSSEEKTVTQICKDTGFEQTWVSHSLRLLKNNNMVESKRDGKYVYYKLDSEIKPILQRVERIAPRYARKGGV